MSLKIGSLFAGYGGLDLGIQAVVPDVTTAWVSEIEPGACKVLAERFPGAPNIGDITAINHADLEPVDIICGGSPCQDLSSAGARAGMTEGTRSNLWVAMRETIAAIQPNYVVWENVKGACSATAASRMESDTRLLGDHPATQPPLRALGRVLGDLANLGYDTQWHGIRASDIGAPHARYRVFALATKHGAPPLPVSGIPAITPSPGPLLSTLAACRRDNGSTISYLVRMQKLKAQDPDNGFSMPAGFQLTMEHERVGGLGMYTPAAQHWERQLGRPAPEALTVRGYYHATITPRFCEWMMGLPEGWITDVDGVSDRQAKAMCGNGVVPQQAAAALQTVALWRQAAA